MPNVAPECPVVGCSQRHLLPEARSRHLRRAHGERQLVADGGQQDAPDLRELCLDACEAHENGNLDRSKRALQAALSAVIQDINEGGATDD
jgi:hypothetical protein